MALSDVLDTIGGGLKTGAQAIGKGAQVAGAVIGDVADPEAAQQRQQDQNAREDQAINAKASVLQDQLNAGRKYGTITPEQEQDLSNQIIGLYNQPRHAPILMERLRQIIHPQGAVAQGPMSETLGLPTGISAYPKGGTVAFEAKQKAAARPQKYDPKVGYYDSVAQSLGYDDYDSAPPEVKQKALHEYTQAAARDLLPKLEQSYKDTFVKENYGVPDYAHANVAQANAANQGWANSRIAEHVTRSTTVSPLQEVTTHTSTTGPATPVQTAPIAQVSTPAAALTTPPGTASAQPKAKPTSLAETPSGKPRNQVADLAEAVQNRAMTFADIRKNYGKTMPQRIQQYMMANGLPIPPELNASLLDKLTLREASLDNTIRLINEIQKDSDLLDKLGTASLVNLAESPGMVSRLAGMLTTDADKNRIERLAGNARSLQEHINVMRAPLGATGFRGKEGWQALQNQALQAMAEPGVNKQVLENSKSLLTKLKDSTDKILTGTPVGTGTAKPPVLSKVGAGKTLTMDNIRDAAQKSGQSVDAVIKQAEDKGYSVTGKPQ